MEKEFSKIKFRLFNKPVWKLLLGDKDKSWQLTTNPYFKCADLIVKWNIMQHFYPYYQEDYLAESWEERLIEAFRISCSSGMPYVHYEATNYLLAGVRDSHVQVERNAFVGGLAASYLRYSFPPLKLDWCDTGSIYLSDFPDTLNHTLKTGDILTAINGVPIDTLIQMKWEKTPASSFQGKMEVLTREKLIGTFRKDSILTMTLKNKEDELYDFSSKATIDYFDYIYTKWQKTEPPFISCYENQIYYINLHSSCSNYQEFKLQIPAMQNSKAILLDVRGYPDYSVADSIITHFSPDSLEWGTFGLPCYRFPDHCDVSYKINEGFLPAVSENNYINTPVYILINHKAMSYAETLIEVMKRNGVGTLTGQSTVGTNGDITHIQLPAFSFIMTAVKDFSGFHGEGIPPDIYISPSIESIRENRDYLVEEVIRLILANEI